AGHLRPIDIVAVRFEDEEVKCPPIQKGRKEAENSTCKNCGTKCGEMGPSFHTRLVSERCKPASPRERPQAGMVFGRMTEDQ
ncbi:hypothetical protein L914_11666, partial [Phytophthora nicotianae]